MPETRPAGVAEKIGKTSTRTATVLVSIVTYKAPDLTIQCLGSLEPEVTSIEGCRVIVTDNCSGDGSAETISQAIEASGWSDWAELVVAPGNDGYASGNNVAIEKDRQGEKPSDYVLILNPDVVVQPGAIRTLVEFMESHPRVGIAGSLCENPDGTPQSSCFGFPGLVDEFLRGVRMGVLDRVFHRFLSRVPHSETAHPADWVSGASMLVRREVFDEIGTLDDQYFLYYEETDFSLNARRRGWDIWYVPDSRIVHFASHYTGIFTPNPGDQKRRPAYWFESRRRYYLKNYGPVYAALIDLAALSGLTLWKLRRLIERKPEYNPPHFFADSWRQSVFVKGFEKPTGKSREH